jgi:indole-3-glycerol phosphate synthase
LRAGRTLLQWRCAWRGLPRSAPRVAESGVGTPEDAARLSRAGYDLALIGSALMTTDDPGVLLKSMIAAGRGARR